MFHLTVRYGCWGPIINNSLGFTDVIDFFVKGKILMWGIKRCLPTF